MDSPLNIVVTGELDCGKSTLLGRLLYDTHSLSQQAEKELRQSSEFNFAHLLDSFQEERLGQFTLDTTQVFLKNKKRQYTLIDVPGHKELLKNMLTGASYANIAILVVDVQKGLQEQTKRHLYILKFLKIEPIIIVLNKMDLEHYRMDSFKKALNGINAFLKKIQINPHCIIPISAKEGECLLKRSNKMPWYKGPSLIDAIEASTEKEKPYNFRFPVQDVYAIKGENIAIGKVISGKISVKEKIRILSINKECKIKKIKIFGKGFISQAKFPESIGIILNTPDKLKRGYILYKGTSPNSSKKILSKIFCIKPLNVDEALTLHCATQETHAKITQINILIDTINFEIHKDPKLIKQTEVAEVVITLDRAIVTERFKDLPELGRFVLQKDSEICAVGIII